MDLEMTGLDPARHVIVEIATLVTDDDLADRGRGSRPGGGHRRRGARRHGRLRPGHAHQSGLLDAIAASTVTLAEAGRPPSTFLRTHVPKARTVPLSGNSIGTDRRFLAA